MLNPTRFAEIWEEACQTFDPVREFPLNYDQVQATCLDAASYMGPDINGLRAAQWEKVKYSCNRQAHTTPAFFKLSFECGVVQALFGEIEKENLQSKWDEVLDITSAIYCPLLGQMRITTSQGPCCRAMSTRGIKIFKAPASCTEWKEKQGWTMLPDRVSDFLKQDCSGMHWQQLHGYDFGVPALVAKTAQEPTIRMEMKPDRDGYIESLNLVCTRAEWALLAAYITANVKQIQPLFIDLVHLIHHKQISCATIASWREYTDLPMTPHRPGRPLPSLHSTDVTGCLSAFFCTATPLKISVGISTRSVGLWRTAVRELDRWSTHWNAEKASMTLRWRTQKLIMPASHGKIVSTR